MDIPLRIVLIIDDLGIGGTQTWLRHLAAGLAARGHALRVYCIRNIAHPANVKDLANFAEVQILGETRFRLLYGFVQLWCELRRWRPDIVQTQLPTSDWIGRLVARAAGVPTVISSVRGRNLDKPWWQRFLDRSTARFADRVVFNSAAGLPEAIRREGIRPEQAVHIPNGVAIPAPVPPERVAALRQSLGIGNTATVLGTVGRLSPPKGHDILLAALPSVLARHPDTILWLVGDGPLRNSLERQAKTLGIAEKVRFLGSRDDVPELLAAIDLVIQPSRFEGMPNAVMEAMAAGKPVVATDVDAVPTLITDGEDGWLTEPEHPVHLAETILQALESPHRAAIGHAAQAKMQAHFPLERMVDAYEQLYRQRLSLDYS
jgi:glycosyltransferase involved in cell wall biosynthesis